MALLHHASAPSTYWTYALATTVYLINRLPTILHSRQSPFEVLFGRVPDYNKLRTFGCQCYPWLVPYRANKFQSKSHLCVFLGYSLTQHAFQCLNLQTDKIIYPIMSLLMKVFFLSKRHHLLSTHLLPHSVQHHLLHLLFL